MREKRQKLVENARELSERKRLLKGRMLLLLERGNAKRRRRRIGVKLRGARGFGTRHVLLIFFGVATATATACARGIARTLGRGRNSKRLRRRLIVQRKGVGRLIDSGLLDQIH